MPPPVQPSLVRHSCSSLPVTNSGLGPCTSQHGFSIRNSTELLEVATFKTGRPELLSLACATGGPTNHGDWAAVSAKPEKDQSRQSKGGGLLRVSETAHECLFLSFFFFSLSFSSPPTSSFGSRASLPVRKSHALLPGIPVFQGELYSRRCAPQQRLGEQGERGARSKMPLK